MSTYAELVEHELVAQMRADLSDWADGQVLGASEDRVIEIMVDRHRYTPVEFIEESERRELLVPNEPAAGVRIHFDLNPAGRPGIPHFLALQGSHHRSEPRLELRENHASFVVQPMGPAEEIKQTLEAIKDNIAVRNRDIAQGEERLRIHAQNIFRSRLRAAEEAQAEGGRAVAELEKLGIPDFEAPNEEQPKAASDTAVAASQIGGDAVEIDPLRQAPAVTPSLTYAAAAPVIGTLEPHLNEIQDLVEKLLERSQDDFTRSICDQILEEVTVLARFTARFDGSVAAAEVVEVPQRFINSTRVFDWIGGAISGKGIDFLDALGGELVEAAGLVSQLLELAANPPA